MNDVFQLNKKSAYELRSDTRLPYKYTFTVIKFCKFCGFDQHLEFLYSWYNVDFLIWEIKWSCFFSSTNITFKECIQDNIDLCTYSSTYLAYFYSRQMKHLMKKYSNFYVI